MAKAIARKAARRTRTGAIKWSSGPLKIRKLNPKPANASADHGSLKVAKRGARTIEKKKIHHSDGTIVTMFTVSANSKTFGSDLRHAFTKSIAKARKENKQKLGVRDYRAERI